MLIEVKHFRMITAKQAQAEKRAETERQRDEHWAQVTMGIDSFPDCPTCNAPPRPQRHEFRLDCERPTQAVRGFAGQVFGSMILGPRTEDVGVHLPVRHSAEVRGVRRRRGQPG